MTLSDDDFDLDVDSYCSMCGRPLDDALDRLDLVAGFVWLTVLVLTGLASLLVVALCLKALL